MTPEELHRILQSPDDAPEPSPAFLRNVLREVRLDAPETRIRFPWGRFTLGLTASAAMAVSGTVLLAPAATSVPTLPPHVAQVLPQLCYATIALLIGFTAVAVPRVLTRP